MRVVVFGLWLTCLACGHSERDPDSDALANGGSAMQGGAGGGPTAGASQGGDSQGGLSAGGVSAGGVAGTPSCYEPTDPGPVTSLFASPEVVWGRISLMVSAEAMEPPMPLPAEVTSEWAGEVALLAFERDVAATGAVPGMRRFLLSWTDMATAMPPFDRDWAALASEEGATLDLLLTVQSESEPERFGIFNDSFWLTLKPSISVRGAALFRALTGQDVPQPPTGHPGLLEPAAGQTRRQALEGAFSDPTCAGCHTLFDPYGFALENFDELGHYREIDAGQPIDAHGTLTLDDQEITFADYAELAPAIAASCTVQRAFADAFLVDAALAAYGEPQEISAADSERVRRAFLIEQRNLRTLVRATAQTKLFLR